MSHIPQQRTFRRLRLSPDKDLHFHSKEYSAETKRRHFRTTFAKARAREHICTRACVFMSGEKL